MKKTLVIVFLSLLLIACGGGEENATQKVNTQILTMGNSAWENARVYKPYSTVPVKVSELSSMTNSPVAISLHGCNGVNDTKDPLYFPIYMASMGYLVIEPDSYFGDIPGSQFSRICVAGDIPRLALINISSRVADAEYAVAKVQTSTFWDGKNLVVQGQSQGAQVLHFLPNIPGATKILYTGFSLCVTNEKWLSEIPKLFVISRNDPWGSPSANCNGIKGWDFHIIEGNNHEPQKSPVGQELIRKFLSLSK